MNIPTIPGSSRVQSPELGVQRSAGPELQAIEAQNQAIQTGLGVVQEYEQRKQKAEDMAAFNQASITTRQTTAAFRDSLHHNPNDKDWVANWQDVAQKTRDDIMADPTLRGTAKQRMALTLDQWQGDTTTEFTTAADVAGSQRRKRTGLLAADVALKDGNEPAASAAVDSLVQTGDMWQEEAAHLKTTFRETIQKNQVETGIGANPMATLNDLEAGKWPNLQPTTRTTLIRQAREQWHVQQMEAYQTVTEGIDNGVIYTKDQLNQLVAAGNLKATSVDTMLRRQAGQTKWDDIPKFAANTIAAVNAIPDGLPADIRRTKVLEIVTSKDYLSLPEAARSEVNKMLNDPIRAERPVASEIFRRAEDEHKAGLFLPWHQKTSSTWFGLGPDETTTKPSENAGPSWINKATPEERADESKAYARYLTKMRDYFRQKPDSTDEEAEAYSANLKKPHIMAAVAANLTAQPATTGTVRVKAKDGRIGTIPAANLAKALEAGYEEIK